MFTLGYSWVFQHCDEFKIEIHSESEHHEPKMPRKCAKTRWNSIRLLTASSFLFILFLGYLENNQGFRNGSSW